jgi:hypothetical protein
MGGRGIALSKLNSVQVYLFGGQTQENKKNNKDQKTWRVCLLINIEVKGLNVSWIYHNIEILNSQLQ